MKQKLQNWRTKCLNRKMSQRLSTWELTEHRNQSFIMNTGHLKLFTATKGGKEWKRFRNRMKKHHAKQCAPWRNYEMIIKEKEGRRLKKWEKGFPEKNNHLHSSQRTPKITNLKLLSLIDNMVKHVEVKILRGSWKHQDISSLWHSKKHSEAIS